MAPREPTMYRTAKRFKQTKRAKDSLPAQSILGRAGRAAA